MKITNVNKIKYNYNKTPYSLSQNPMGQTQQTQDVVSFGKNKDSKESSELRKKKNTIDLYLKLSSFRTSASNQKILKKLENNVDLINDKVVLDELVEQSQLLNLFANEPFYKYSLTTFKNLVDGVNCANNKYSKFETCDSNTTKPYYEKLKELSPKHADWIKNNIDNYNKSVDSSDIFKGDDSDNDSGSRYVRDFLDEQRFSSLKEYLINTNADNENFNDYLYEKYYLKQKNFPKDTENLLLKFNKEYGIKMFLPLSDITPDCFKNICNELQNWKKAGGSDVNFPKVLDMSVIKDMYLKDTGALSNNSFIKLRLDTNHYLSFLRHEMIHLNTENNCEYQNYMGTEKLEEEMRSAGIPEKSIEYSRTNRREFVAVAGERDTTNYSQRFKDTLVKSGFPEYVFDLEPIRH